MPIDREYLYNTIAEMVRINSVNSDLIPGSAGEGELAAYIATHLKTLGLEVEIDEVQPGRPNIVGILRGQGGGRSLMLNGHTDTVGVSGMSKPFAAAVRGGKMYGRGAFDMKASLAGMLAAVQSLVTDDIKLAGDVVLVFVIDEEYGSLGTEAIVRKYKTNGAIVTEPSGLRVGVAHRGFQWMIVDVMGRAAHGSRYMDGIDANRLMGHFLVALDRYAQELLGRSKHPLLGPPSIHAALLRGGSSQSVYAARAQVELERRTLPGEDSAKIVAEIQALLDHLTETVPNFQATVTADLFRPAFEVSLEAPIVQTLMAAGEAVFGKRPKTYGELWWMDSALLQAAGIETVIIGPAGAGAHADEEWVDLDSVYDYTRILVNAIQRYCGLVRGG